MFKSNSTWSSVRSKLPNNIFNFTIDYIINTLPTRYNLLKRGLSQKLDCSFCFQSESLLHVIAGYQIYLRLGRFTWRHNSILHVIASTFQYIPNSILYADVPSFVTPSVITDDTLRPDLLLHFQSKCPNIVELTVCFESNMVKSANRRQFSYLELVKHMEEKYKQIKFAILSIIALGLFDKTSSDFTDTMKDLHMDNVQTCLLIGEIIYIAINTSYYVIWLCNKQWYNPVLMKY